MDDNIFDSLGVKWTDETEMREEVAARVASTSSADAIKDQKLLQTAWESLQKSERTVADLEDQLDNLEKQLAIQGNGITIVGGRNHVNDTAKSVSSQIQVVRFKLNTSKREAEKNASNVEKVQREVEGRQRQRMEKALNEEKRRNALEAQAGSHTNVSSTDTIKTEAGLVDTVVTDLKNGETQGSPLFSYANQVFSPLGSPHRALPRPQKNSRIPPGSHSLPQPLIASTFSSDSKLRPPHTGPLTLDEYTGGEVLPSINRVKLTRADLRVKHNRYEDDGDQDLYIARLEKRRRLEKAEALLRRKDKLSEIKMETLHPGSRNNSIDVKQEVDLSSVNHAIKCEAIDSKGKGVSSLSHADTEVIDVDALMENEQDLSEEILARAMETVKEKPGSVSDSRLTNLKSEKSLTERDQDATSSGAASESFSDGEEKENSTVMIGNDVHIDSLTYERLFDYQREGVQWLVELHRHRCGGILGDEMGLGKTIQIAVMLNALHRSGKLIGPALIVCPMTVLRQWVAELHRWAPYMRTCVMHDSSHIFSSGKRENLIEEVRGTPAVVLTTYSALRQHCQLLHRAGFQYLILDEGHKISNPDAHVTLAAKSFPTPHRLILSGTPVQNTLKELWCLFDFVKPGLLGTQSRFIEEFDQPINASKNLQASSLVLTTAVECARELQNQIAPYLLRRLKRHAITSLPQKYERVIRCPLSDEQLEKYVELLTSPEVQTLFSQTLSYPVLAGGLNRDGRDPSGSLHVAGPRYKLLASQKQMSGVRLQSFRVMNQLRQICNHVDIYNVKKGEDEVEESMLREARLPGSFCFRSNNPVNYRGSAKLLVLRRVLKEWKRFQHRVLIFSQTRMMLDIIENMCEQESHRYIRLDGTTSGAHRQELMDRFNEDETIFVALLTTRVGGVGVNLTGADRVVLFDPDWNPVTDEQARERAWRIGQKRNVCIYRLISGGTVEEAILRRQMAKVYVTEKVLKDPTLQRYFYQQSSFVENFYLSTEYGPRVPPGKKHILASHEIADALSRQSEKDVFSEYGDFWTVKKAADALEKIKEEDIEACDSPNVTEASPNVEEKEFGTLLRVPDISIKSETLKDLSHQSPIDPKSTHETETSLLQSLVDGNNLVVSSGDRLTQQLARFSASDTMQRVTNSSVRTFADQQQEFNVASNAESTASTGRSKKFRVQMK